MVYFGRTKCTGQGGLFKTTHFNSPTPPSCCLFVCCSLLACHLESDLSFLVNRFMSVNVTQRELHDISAEIFRIKVQFELCLLSGDIKSLETELDEASLRTMTELRKKLSSGKPIEEEILDEMLRSLANIR